MTPSAITISMVQHASATACQDVFLSDILEAIKACKWKSDVERIRKAFAQGGKDAANPLKKRLPAVTFSGRFRQRKASQLDKHSGILCVDLDSLNGNLDSIREKLLQDKHVMACFVSPTGSGLKALIPIQADAGSHEASFRAAQRLFQERYGIAIDEQCKDVARLCFVSADPNILVRDSAEILQPVGTRQEPAPEADPYDKLVEQFGLPYTVNDKGVIRVNQMFFVARFAVEHLVLHEPNERDFYTYDPQTGAWTPCTADAIKAMFSEDWQHFANEDGNPTLVPLRTNALLESLTSLLRGHVEKPEAFAHKGRVIHLANGMLHLDNNGAELRGFSPDYYSRNVCPIPWDPDADCPRFKSELLASALDPEDISLLQRWCGALLLGRNRAQRIMLLTGTAGGGKSTLLEIVEGVIGPMNVCQLRTEHLSERFELSRFLRKTMLSGKDVRGDFLQTEGAHVLKALVGHDLLSAERKNSNSEFQLRGEFGVAVSCNSRLRVKLDGDVDAWRRRLLIVRYEKPKPKERILDFAKVLLAEEASGILRWMVDGAIMHLRECDTVGDYRLSDEQEGRVDQLLAESDSIRHFLIERIQPAKGCDLATGEIVSAYFDYCSEKGWTAFSFKAVERALPDLMLELFRIARNAHVVRNDKRQNGYPNVALIAPTGE